MVPQKGEFVGKNWVSSWGWRRDPIRRELGEIEDLRRVLEGYTPKRGEDDRVIWKLDSLGSFSVKALRSLIAERSASGGGVGEWKSNDVAKINTE